MLNKKLKDENSKLYGKKTNELVFLMELILPWTCAWFYIYYSCEILFGSLIKQN